MAANFLQQFPKLPNLGKFHVPSKLSGLYRPRKSVPEHQAMVQRQASMSLVAPHGLQNLTGENNCFLNSAIQVLWHVDVFRRSFRELEGHACVGKSCIFCALKDLFTQFQHSNETTIPPDVLRHALAECYREKHRFQLNLMDDAAECFEKLLEQIHFHLTGNDDLDSCAAPYCISHQCFALNILERTECVCGATSEPLSFVQFVHYISSSALVKEAQKYHGHQVGHTDEATPTDTPTTTDTALSGRNSSTFGKILHAASSYGEYRECPNFAHCKKNVDVKRILLNCPDIVCLGLIWDSDQPPVDDIMAVVNNIGLTLQLSDVFDTVSAENAHYNQYHLTAAIAYYGRHYSTFCLHSRKKEWIYFDDANFRTIGEEWSHVCDVIRKAHYQPLLLVYSNQFAEKIDVSQAPTEITRIYPKDRKVISSKDSAKTEKIEEVSSEHTVTSVDEPANQIKAEPVVQDKPPLQHSTPPTEAIDPMTLSLIPCKNNQLTQKDNSTSSQESHVTNHTTVGWMAQFDSGDTEPVAHASSHHSVLVSTSEPVNDLMMFSITPDSIAKMTKSSSHNGAAQSIQPPVSQPQALDDSAGNDLIEFSISPSLLGNAHNSQIQFLAADNEAQLKKAMSGSNSQTVKPKQSPELRVAKHSPQLSRRMATTTAQLPSPAHQQPRGEETSTKSSTDSETAPQFQRQTSFPFQNKQPAPMPREEMKSEVHALPQSSDFASRFRGYTTLEGDVLKPHWEHFADSSRERRNEDPGRYLSASPEAWTVLNAAGDEEGTFHTRKRSPEITTSHESNTGDAMTTPAITSLKRVASAGPSQGHSFLNRPLPSIPHSSSDSAVTAHHPSSAGGRRSESPFAVRSGVLRDQEVHPSTSTHHRLHDRNVASSKAKSHHELNYVDPDDLLFFKPQTSVLQSDPTPSGGQTTIKHDQRQNGMGTGIGDSSSKSIPLVSLSDQTTVGGTNTPHSVVAGGGRAVLSGNGGSPKSDKEAVFSSLPITADPLYALPEKLKHKFASQATSSTPASTGTLIETTSTIGFTNTTSSAPLSTSTASTSTSLKPVTGAGYLSQLLQERQSARQQTSANAATPTGDLLEASTKAKAESHIDKQQTAPSSSNHSQRERPKPATGKEYLEELLLKRQNSKKSAQSSVSTHQPRNPSSQPIGSDPLYAVPDKPHLRKESALTERQSDIRAAPVSSKTTLPSNPSNSAVHIGNVPQYAAPGKHHSNGSQSRHNISTTQVSPQSAVQSRTHGGVRSETTVMSAIPEQIHSQLLEARDLWAKAELSLESDKAVAYMLFTQHNGIITRVLQCEAVRSNLPLHKYVSNIKEEGSRRAAAIKSSITSATPSTSRTAPPQACQRCGNVRNLDTNRLCGPCKLRVQIGK